MARRSATSARCMRSFSFRLASAHAGLSRLPLPFVSFLLVSQSSGFSITALAADGAGAMDPHAYTALPIAAARALSTERNAGVKDPLARKLVAGEDQLLRVGANGSFPSIPPGPLRCIEDGSLCEVGRTRAKL